MITKISEAKTLVKCNSKDCKCKFDSLGCYSNQKWNNDKFQFQCKKYQKCKNDYNWNPSKSICENSAYLKIIADDLVIVCDVIISIKHSADVTNTISVNVRYTVSRNCDDKEVRFKMNFVFCTGFISDQSTIYSYL